MLTINNTEKTPKQDLIVIVDSYKDHLDLYKAFYNKRNDFNSYQLLTFENYEHLLLNPVVMGDFQINSSTSIESVFRILGQRIIGTVVESVLPQSKNHNFPEYLNSLQTPDFLTHLYWAQLSMNMERFNNSQKLLQIAPRVVVTTPTEGVNYYKDLVLGAFLPKPETRMPLVFDTISRLQNEIRVQQ